MVYRKVPTKIGDYLHGLSEIKEVFAFIRTEVVDEKSRTYIKKMIVFTFFHILFQALAPIALGTIFTGFANRSVHTIIMGIVLTISCMLVQKILDRYVSKNREWMTGVHWRNMYKRMSELFLEKSPGQHIQEQSLNVANVERGKQNLFSLLNLIFFDAIPVVMQLVVSLVLIIYASIVSGTAMVLAMCLYVTYSIYLNFHVMQVCTPIDKSMRRLNRRRVERMERVIRVITSSQIQREVEEMDGQFKLDIEKDINFWLWFIEHTTWRAGVNILLFGFVLAYGSYLTWNGVWQVGFLYPLFNWSTRIIENIWQLGSIEQKINWNLPSVKSMIKALSITPDVTNITNPIWISTKIPQKIVIEGVSHAYPAAENDTTLVDDADENDDEDDAGKTPEQEEIPHTIKKVSFTIEPGEKVALIGPSGAGKTTLMRLLLRFMDPNHGSISVGGHDLRTIAVDSWRQSIGYIAQHPEVFDGTIKDNITYRLSPEDRANISDEDLWKLMRRLEIDFGTRLEKGLDTKVGKHGLKISGGQAQRLMIGAAVIGNPWFMIIDEATSSLDSTTERKVQKGLAESLDGNTSAVIIAHRLSTVRHLCTKFVILKPAEKVNNGDSQVEAIAHSFEELYKISPTFRELADDQGIIIN